jgi:hypothetical protein
MNGVYIAEKRIRQPLRRVFQGNDRVNDGCVDDILHGVDRGPGHGESQRCSALKGQAELELRRLVGAFLNERLLLSCARPAPDDRVWVKLQDEPGTAATAGSIPEAAGKSLCELTAMIVGETAGAYNEPSYRAGRMTVLSATA